MTRGIIFHESIHEKNHVDVKEMNTQGIHIRLKVKLQSDDTLVQVVTLDEEECGFTNEVRKDTNVLIWWGYMALNKVNDETAKPGYRVDHLKCLHRRKIGE